MLVFVVVVVVVVKKGAFCSDFVCYNVDFAR